MNVFARIAQVLGLVIGLAFANMVYADQGGGNPTDGTDNGKGNGGVNEGNGNGDKGNGNGDSGTPSAPEPGVILMAAAGGALGGGYILWRRRKLSRKSAT